MKNQASITITMVHVIVTTPMGTHLYLPISMKMSYHNHKLAMFMLALAYKIEIKGICIIYIKKCKHVQGHAILMSNVKTLLNICNMSCNCITFLNNIYVLISYLNYIQEIPMFQF
jgi:hypothetical protein